MEMQKRRLGVSILEEDPLKPFVFRSSKDYFLEHKNRQKRQLPVVVGTNIWIFIFHISRDISTPRSLFGCWKIKYLKVTNCMHKYNETRFRLSDVLTSISGILFIPFVIRHVQRTCYKS